MANHSREVLKANTDNPKLSSFIKSKTPLTGRYIPKMLTLEKNMDILEQRTYNKYVRASASGATHYLFSISIANCSLPPSAL